MDEAKDPEINEYYKNDKLMYHGKIRVGTGLTIKDSTDYARSSIDKVTTPCYIIQGKDDTVVHHSGATNFFDKIPVTDKTYILLDSKL